MVLLFGDLVGISLAIHIAIRVGLCIAQVAYDAMDWFQGKITGFSMDFPMKIMGLSWKLSLKTNPLI